MKVFFANLSEKQEERYTRLDILAYTLFGMGDYIAIEGPDDVWGVKDGFKKFYIGRFIRGTVFERVAREPHHDVVRLVTLDLPTTPERLREKENSIMMYVPLSNHYDGICDVYIPLLRDHELVPDEFRGMYGHIFLDYEQRNQIRHRESHNSQEALEAAIKNWICTCSG